jgi:flavin reductase (NADH)
MDFTEHVNVESYRSFMAGFPSGVAVTTALNDDGTPSGMTSTSLCSVSLEPPTLLVCLRFGQTLSFSLASGRFTLNLLDRGSQDVANLFASKTPSRFDHVAWHLPPGAAGPHLSKATHAAADCRIVATETVGDHTVLFGQVYRVTNYSQPNPLLYGLRVFSAWK